VHALWRRLPGVLRRKYVRNRARLRQSGRRRAADLHDVRNRRWRLLPRGHLPDRKCVRRERRRRGRGRRAGGKQVRSVRRRESGLLPGPGTGQRHLRRQLQLHGGRRWRAGDVHRLWSHEPALLRHREQPDVQRRAHVSAARRWDGSGRPLQLAVATQGGRDQFRGALGARGGAGASRLGLPGAFGRRAFGASGAFSELRQLRLPIARLHSRFLPEARRQRPEVTSGRSRFVTKKIVDGGRVWIDTAKI